MAATIKDTVSAQAALNVEAERRVQDALDVEAKRQTEQNALDAEAKIFAERDIAKSRTEEKTNSASKSKPVASAKRVQAKKNSRPKTSPSTATARRAVMPKPANKTNYNKIRTRKMSSRRGIKLKPE